MKLTYVPTIYFVFYNSTLKISMNKWQSQQKWVASSSQINHLCEIMPTYHLNIKFALITNTNHKWLILYISQVGYTHQLIIMQCVNSLLYQKHVTRRKRCFLMILMTDAWTYQRTPRCTIFQLTSTYFSTNDTFFSIPN